MPNTKSAMRRIKKTITQASINTEPESENKNVTTGSSKNVTQQIKELNELYESGVLTKEEFEKAKKKLLN